MLVKASKGIENKDTTPQMDEIIDQIKIEGKINDQEIGNLLGIKRSRILELTKRMKDIGLIKQIGRGASKSYVLAF